jgi:hypothetical protein
LLSLSPKSGIMLLISTPLSPGICGIKLNDLVYVREVLLYIFLKALEVVRGLEIFCKLDFVRQIFKADLSDLNELRVFSGTLRLCWP